MAKAFDLTGKTALITGASQGLGAGFATTLARAGAKVALAARQTGKLETLKDMIEGEGGTACAVAMDVTDPASIRAAFDATEAALGPIHVLVNNAGIAITKPFLEISEADWDTVLDTNLKGCFLAGQEAAKRMRGCLALHFLVWCWWSPGRPTRGISSKHAKLAHLSSCMILSARAAAACSAHWRLYRLGRSFSSSTALWWRTAPALKTSVGATNAFLAAVLSPP